MIYEIKNDNLVAKVDSKGCQLISILANGKERLWQNENGSWAKHAPILFPHAGKCSVVVNGVTYKQAQHGFARDLEWELVEIKDNEITMKLIQSDYTKEQYPYDFIFLTTYRLEGNKVAIEQTVRNPMNTPIYFSIGAHDSFALDETINNYYAEFEKEENFESISCTDFESLISLGKGDVIDLSSTLLDNSGSIILSGINSRKVCLKHKGDDKLLAEVVFPEYSVLLLWHPTDSKMVCIEPWINLPDSKKDEDIEFKDKKNIIKLEPYESKTLIRSISYF